MAKKEQRREPCQTFRRWVEVLVLGTEPGQPPQFQRCGANDLSSRGARICTPQELPVEAKLLVMFPRGQRGPSIVRFAAVKNARSGATGWAECGLEFCAMPDALKDLDLEKLFEAARGGVAELPPDLGARAA